MKDRRHAITSLLRHPLTWITLASFIVASVYSLSRWPQMLPSGYDLGIFDQVVRSYSRFQAPIVSLKGDDFNILGDHFHPILVVLAPLYWVWDDPRVLLIAQAAIVSSACVPVWRYTARRLEPLAGPGRLVPSLITAAFILGWPIQALIDFDFHEVAFAVPLIAWAIDALDRRRDLELAIAAGLLLLVREDMGAVVAMLGVLRLFHRPRWVGAAFIAGGLAAFALVVGVVIPAFSSNGFAYWEYSVLGDSAGDALVALVTRPGEIAAAFFVPAEKTLTLLALLLPLLFLPLLSPVSIIALPILAQRFLADRENLWGTSFHYNAPIWVVFVLASVDALARIVGWMPKTHPLIRQATVLVVAFIVVAVPIVGTSVRANNTEGLFPYGRMLQEQAWKQTQHMADQRASLEHIPPGACVAVDDRLVPRLLRSNTVTVPGVSRYEPDFYIVDTRYDYPAKTPANWTTAETIAHAQALGFTRIAQYGTVLVYQAPSGGGTMCGRH